MTELKNLLNSFRLDPEDLVELFIDVEPKPVQSVRYAARAGYVQTFQPKKQKEWKARVKTSVQQQLPIGFKKFGINDYIAVSVLYVFEPVSNLKKSEKALIESGGFILKNKKPDVNDNLNKGLFDALTGVLWEDDSRVVHVEATKVYGNRTGMCITAGKVNNSIKILDYISERLIPDCLREIHDKFESEDER